MQQVFDVINACVHETTHDIGIADLSALVLAYANDTDTTPPNDAEVMYHERMNTDTQRLFAFHRSVRELTDDNIKKASRPLTCQKRSSMDQSCLVAPISHGRMQYEASGAVFDARHRMKTVVSELRLRGLCRNPRHAKNGFACDGCNAICTMQQAQLGLWTVAADLSNQVFILREQMLNQFRATRSKKVRAEITAEFERNLESIRAREVPRYTDARNRVLAEHARLLPAVSANAATATAAGDAVTASVGDKRPSDAPVSTAAPPPAKKAKTVDTRSAAILFPGDGEPQEAVDVPEGGLSHDVVRALVGIPPTVGYAAQTAAGNHAMYLHDSTAATSGKARNDAASRSLAAAIGHSLTFQFHGSVLLCDHADVAL